MRKPYAPRGTYTTLRVVRLLQSAYHTDFELTIQHVVTSVERTRNARRLLKRLYLAGWVTFYSERIEQTKAFGPWQCKLTPHGYKASHTFLDRHNR